MLFRSLARCDVGQALGQAATFGAGALELTARQAGARIGGELRGNAQRVGAAALGSAELSALTRGHELTRHAAAEAGTAARERDRRLDT